MITIVGGIIRSPRACIVGILFTDTGFVQNYFRQFNDSCKFQPSQGESACQVRIACCDQRNALDIRANRGMLHRERTLVQTSRNGGVQERKASETIGFKVTRQAEPRTNNNNPVGTKNRRWAAGRILPVERDGFSNFLPLMGHHRMAITEGNRVAIRKQLSWARPIDGYAQSARPSRR